MAQTETTAGTIVGYFEDRSKAENAVSALKDAGFSSAHLGVAHRETGAGIRGTAESTAKSVEAKGEGMWDKVKSFFEGGDVEPYASERRDGDLATREITADPSYGSAGSAQAGTAGSEYATDDLRGTLTGMSVPDEQSRYFDHRFGTSDDGVLVTVSAPGRESEAESILRRFDADLGDKRADYDYSAVGNTPARADGAQNIQLLGETLRAHKERVSRGEVTLRKEVTTEMKTIQVPVSREELVIERHAVDGGATPSGNFGDASEIRIPLSEEIASAEKSTFVREEVSVGKRAVADTREVSGEVRSEELIVDDETKNIPQTQK